MNGSNDDGVNPHNRDIMDTINAAVDRCNRGEITPEQASLIARRLWAKAQARHAADIWTARARGELVEW
jgi:hypothetical protein